MKCEKCKKSFEFLNVFSPFGHDNLTAKEESHQNLGYCDKCFEIRKKELNIVVYECTGESYAQS